MMRPSTPNSGAATAEIPTRVVREPYATPMAPRAAAAPTGFGPAYLVGAAYLFFIFSHASEFIDTTGRLHLVVLFAAAAAIAAVAGGQLMKSLSSSSGVALTIFTLFLILSIPFSSWKGGSLKSFMDSWWKSYIAFFLVSALIFSVQQMRRSLFYLGIGTIGIIYFSFKATKINDDGRLSVEYGSLGNSNDLAGALLMGLPFLLYVMVDKKRSALVRIVFSSLTLVLLYVLFKTGSRSGLLALAFMAFIGFVKTTNANRFKIIALCGIVAVVLPMVAGKALMSRYKTMFTTTVTSEMSEDTASAVLSSQARRQLVYNAIELTFKHPIFGVGLGNFGNQSAELEISKGREPLWFTSHDIYLLVSSETGVIGFLLYMATILFTLGTLIRIERVASKNPELEEVSAMAFCLLMATAAFASTGLFSTNAYTAHLPMFAGLAVALDRITKPVLAEAEERRMEKFRQGLPVPKSRFAGSAVSALSVR